jgi:hypothetical protein
VRERGAGHLHRADEVGVDLAADLLVADFFGGAEQGVSGVADHDVDASQRGERLVDHPADGGGVGDVQLAPPQPIAVSARQVGQRRGVARGGGHAVTAAEE